jgi:hypothetical protein
MASRLLAGAAVWLVMFGLPLLAIWQLPSPSALGHWTIWCALFLLACGLGLAIGKLIDRLYLTDEGRE